MSGIVLFKREYIQCNTHTRACVTEFFIFYFSADAEFIDLHECACLVGFVAVTDKFFSLYITYKYTIRIPSSVLNEGVVYGAPGTQYPSAVKTASQIALT